jgi:hypothetical protein
MGKPYQLSVGQDIEDIAHTSTVHSVQFRETTVAARHRSELLVLHVQEPGNTRSSGSYLPSPVFRPGTFDALKLVLLHRPAPYKQ